jgi:hypothetical protein
LFVLIRTTTVTSAAWLVASDIGAEYWYGMVTSLRDRMVG